MTDSKARLHQLQSEEMALRNLLDSVSNYTRADIEALLQLVRDEIENERQQMKADAERA